MQRTVILDIETTDLFVDAGERLISVGIVELVDDKPTGKTLHIIVNPQRDSHPAALAAHRMTPEFLAQFPTFSASHAQAIADFIADAPIVITCRTVERNGKPYTLDEAFITAELSAVGVTPPPASQWVNVRRWAEALYGADNARLDAVLDRYGIDRTKRDQLGHGALLDAELLAAAYPRLKSEYAALTAPTARPAPPQPRKP